MSISIQVQQTFVYLVGTTQQELEEYYLGKLKLRNSFHPISTK